MLVHNNRLMVRCDCDGVCDCAAGTGAPASAVQPAAWTQQAFVGQPLLRRALCLAVQDRVQVLVRRISTTHRVELHDIYLRTIRCVVPRNRPARLRIAFTICVVPDSILCKFKNDATSSTARRSSRLLLSTTRTRTTTTSACSGSKTRWHSSSNGMCARAIIRERMLWLASCCACRSSCRRCHRRQRQRRRRWHRRRPRR